MSNEDQTDLINYEVISEWLSASDMDFLQRMRLKYGQENIVNKADRYEVVVFERGSKGGLITKTLGKIGIPEKSSDFDGDIELGQAYMVKVTD